MTDGHEGNIWHSGNQPADRLMDTGVTFDIQETNQLTGLMDTGVTYDIQETNQLTETD